MLRMEPRAERVSSIDAYSFSEMDDMRQEVEYAKKQYSQHEEDKKKKALEE